MPPSKLKAHHIRKTALIATLSFVTYQSAQQKQQVVISGIHIKQTLPCLFVNYQTRPKHERCSSMLKYRKSQRDWHIVTIIAVYLNNLLTFT